NNSNNQPSSTENNNIIVKFNNYKLEAKMIMTISGIEVDTTFTGEIDELNQKAHLVIDMNSMGFVLTTESYTDYKTGYSYIKNPYATEWVKQNGGTQFVDLNNVASQLKNMKNVTKIDDNHYKVIIAKEDIIGMLETTEADTDEITGDIAADVYLKDGYISEIYYDFSQMMDEFDEFTFDMKIYDYDKAGNVEIPQDIIESATEY
ncbi:MAG: hypothetical protein IJR82_01180, partial [Bacilli bacterium]|nr:hypothetical protein [Bacilli bacterium]